MSERETLAQELERIEHAARWTAQRFPGATLADAQAVPASRLADVVRRAIEALTWRAGLPPEGERVLYHADNLTQPVVAERRGRVMEFGDCMVSAREDANPLWLPLPPLPDAAPPLPGAGE